MDFYDSGFGYDGGLDCYADPGVQFPDGTFHDPFVDAPDSASTSTKATSTATRRAAIPPGDSCASQPRDAEGSPTWTGILSALVRARPRSGQARCRSVGAAEPPGGSAGTSPMIGPVDSHPAPGPGGGSGPAGAPAPRRGRRDQPAGAADGRHRVVRWLGRQRAWVPGCGRGAGRPGRRAQHRQRGDAGDGRARA